MARGMELGQASVVQICLWTFHTCWITGVSSIQDLLGFIVLPWMHLPRRNCHDLSGN